MFSLVVDDFCVNFEGIQHAKHLKESLEHHYEVSMDWEGRLFCVIILDWNYNMKHFYLSIPGYVQRKRTKYQHPDPLKPQHSSYQATPIRYGTKVQHPVQSDATALIYPEQIKRFQYIVGSFICYGRACNTTLTASLSAITSCQIKGTETFLANSYQLLYYLATHPDDALCYHSSDMILSFDTDASYLSEPGGISHVAVYYYMTNKGPK